MSKSSGVEGAYLFGITTASSWVSGMLFGSAEFLIPISGINATLLPQLGGSSVATLWLASAPSIKYRIFSSGVLINKLSDSGSSSDVVSIECK